MRSNTFRRLIPARRFIRHFSGFGKRNWETTDFYSVLGVQKTASAKDIKSAYYKLAKKFHPDVVDQMDDEKEKERLKEKFKQVQEANEVLSDEKAKIEYDSMRSWKGTGFKAGEGGKGSPNTGFTGYYSNVSGDYDPYEWMKKSHGQDKDFQRMWKETKGRRVSRDEYEKMHERGKQYQREEDTEPFRKKKDVNLVAVMNYWFVGVIVVLFGFTFARVLFVAGNSSKLKENMEKNEREKQLEEKEHEVRQKDLEKKLKDRSGGFPISITFEDSTRKENYRILTRENWINDYPTYRGTYELKRGERMVLWFDKPSSQWRISLRKHVGTSMCTAFVEDKSQDPTKIQEYWYVYSKKRKVYEQNNILSFFYTPEPATVAM